MGLRPPVSAALECALTTAIEDLDRLEQEWRALYDSALSPGPPQGYPFVRAAWQAYGGPSGMTFAVATCRQDGRLVGLWPVCRTRSAVVHRLESVGFGAGEEYSGPLVLEGPASARITRALLHKLRDFGSVVKTTVPADHPLVKPRITGLARYSHRVNSPATRLRNHASFEDWFNSKSRSFRQGFRHDRRKLAEGRIVEVMDGRQGVTASQAIIDWQFEEKRRWLARKGARRSWVNDDRPRALLKALAAQTDPTISGVEPWALMVDGVPAAGAICFVSRTAVELFMFAMNPEFKTYGPGSLLLEDIARSAHRRGRDLDFRVTPEAYKLRWADCELDYRTFIIALTPAGYATVLRAVLRSWALPARRFAKKRLLKIRAALTRSAGGALTARKTGAA